MKNLKRIIAIVLLVIIAVSPVISTSFTSLSSMVASAATTIKLNATSKILNPKQTYTLKLNGATKSVYWGSSKTSVATVSSKGVVTAKAEGTANIIAVSNGVAYTCKITVATPKINKTSVSVAVGKTYTLSISGTSQTKTWSSSDTSVATVDKNGKVTAKKAGTSTISCKLKDGTKLTCKVTVTKNTSKSAVVNVVLCEDKNFSVKLKEIKNGQMVLIFTNKSKNDFYVDLDYLYFNDRAFYGNYYTAEIYAGTSKTYTIGEDDIGKYSFTGGVLKGCFEYGSLSLGYDVLKFNKTINTGLAPSPSQKLNFTQKLLAEDDRIKVYIVKTSNGKIKLNIYNKSSDNYGFEINYLTFGGKTYYAEGYTTQIYSKLYRQYTVDEDDLGSKYTYSSGKIKGQFEYGNFDIGFYKLKFDKTVSW